MSVHARPARALATMRLDAVDLITGGLLMIAVGLAMIGPLVAALLIRHSGAGPTETVSTMSLTLLVIAVVVSISAGAALCVTARRRRDSGRDLN
ncbi:hypothetical protein ACFO5K_24870 [Nocardia halotolerans]|uniref:Uncharacterized protein n=1 Tax=Nocardia halotolerans TaxID=1755878 RepID=A0ABV8VMM2_9NOCA